MRAILASKKGIQMTEQASEYFVIDAHCDTLMVLSGRSIDSKEKNSPSRDFFSDEPQAPVDLPKLKRGRVACQVMALFLEDDQCAHAFDAASRMIDIFDSLVAASNSQFVQVRSASDIRSAWGKGQTGALLSIEGAEALEGSLDRLDDFYARGVRAVGITWNRRNAFGRGLKGEGEGGLTALGKALVEKMQEMGMVIDVSHLSEEGFDEVAELTKGPFIASHSNAREVCLHPRNLTDRQIRMIADHGGAVGCVFVPYFVAQDPEACSLEALIAHIDRIVDKGGIETCALGSDFDGYIQQEASVIRNAGEFPLIYEALRKHGYSHADASKILGENWLRVFEDIMG